VAVAFRRFLLDEGAPLVAQSVEFQLPGKI